MLDSAASSPLKRSDRIGDIEREILRALCAPRAARAAREVILCALADHSWSSPDNRVVYEAICRLRSGDTRAWRSELPAEATRMGFPDVDWSKYFETAPAAGRNLGKLLRELQKRMKARA